MLQNSNKSPTKTAPHRIKPHSHRTTRSLTTRWLVAVFFLIVSGRAHSYSPAVHAIICDAAIPLMPRAERHQLRDLVTWERFPTRELKKHRRREIKNQSAILRLMINVKVQVHFDLKISRFPFLVKRYILMILLFSDAFHRSCSKF